MTFPSQPAAVRKTLVPHSGKKEMNPNLIDEGLPLFCIQGLEKARGKTY